jgi:hypothetical protein
MQTFRSPLFIFCLILFIIHQVMQKGLHLYNTWIDAYIDNILAMPIILSLWRVEKILLWSKGSSYKLSILEISVATVYLSLVSEVIFPLFSKKFYTDSIDVVLYCIGAALFFWFNKFSNKI